MTYCYSKDPIACIKYTGENLQDVVDFIKLHCSFDPVVLLSGNRINRYKEPVKIGAWFVNDVHEEGDGVLRYQNEKDFLDAYGLLEEE